MSSVPTFKYGYVVGKFINSKGDSDDLDRLPDYVGAKLNPTFTRVRGQYVQPLDTPEFGIHGAMVYHEPVVAGVTNEGFLTGDVDSNGLPLPDAKPGLWLVTGRYRVSLGSQFPSMEIEVLESHTEDAPLDLSTEQEYVPPPGVIVNTLPLPPGGEPGQVYGWTDTGIGWYTPPDGASAYELAVRNGFVGTEAEWIQSLEGNPGFSLTPDPNLEGFYIIRGGQMLIPDSDGLIPIGEIS